MTLSFFIIWVGVKEMGLEEIDKLKLEVTPVMGGDEMGDYYGLNDGEVGHVVWIAKENDDGDLEAPGTELADEIINTVEQYLKKHTDDYNIKSIERFEQMDGPDELLVRFNDDEEVGEWAV